METLANPTPTVPAERIECNRADIQQHRPSQRDRLLTVEEIADYIQVKPKTIYNWASLGIIPCIRMNKRIVRFKLEKVIKWLAGYEQKGRGTYKISWDKYLERLER